MPNDRGESASVQQSRPAATNNPAAREARPATVEQRPDSPPPVWRKLGDAAVVVAIGVVVVALGLFAVRLNERFYAGNQPFFDSLSYNARVHNVMCICRESGLAAALHTSCSDGSVCLPYLISSFAAIFCEPSRAIGIWIQTGELLLLTLSLLYYFKRIRQLSTPLAALSLAPFLLVQCLYIHNGGLSDFRMDLSLMLLFSLTATWYLIATATESRVHYIVLGLACGTACLFRATAPMYFLVAIGPLAAIDLLMHRPWRKRVGGLALATGIAAAVSLWFFIRNYAYLYYYYAVWNTDANAHLPIRQSAAHFRFVEHHIGDCAVAFVVLFHLILGIDAVVRRRAAIGSWISSLRMPRLNWRALWLGFAPAAMLVVRGAGLNPFVCMPSVFGCVLFLMFPLSSANLRRISLPAAGMLLLAAIACFGSAMRAGWKEHLGDAPESMAAHKAAIATIVADAHEAGRLVARFATTHVFYLNTSSLAQVATFDMPGNQSTSDTVSVDGVRLAPDNLFSLPAEADWRKATGSTNAEKVDNLIAQSGKQIDYLIIPTAASSEFVQEHIAFNVINRYAVELRDRLLASGQWEEISGDIRNSNDEVVRVYRNVGPAHVDVARAAGAAAH